MKEFLEKLHHIGIPTTDMDSTIDFYTKLGGEIIFEKVDEDDGNPCRVTHIRFSDLIIELYEREKNLGESGAIDHIAFQVNDIEGAFRWAQNMKFTFFDEKILKSSYWKGGMRWFILIGCNGEKIEFAQK